MASPPTPQNSHFLQNKSILISGAGISGLAFALSLHKLWPSISPSTPVPAITLIERDPSAVPPNREGYSLSLRSDRPSAGIQTLQKMGMLDRLLDVAIAGLGAQDEGGNAREEERGEGFVVWDRDWNEVLKMRGRTPPGLPVAGMRIARGNLRRELVAAAEVLPGVEIRWGESVRGVSAAADGGIEVQTSTGTIKADILIAADGSSSKLRTLLRPSDGLHFAGPTCINGTTGLEHLPSGRADQFGAIISGAGPALFVAPVNSEEMLWGLSWRVDEPPQPKKRPMPEEESREIMEEARKIGAPVYGERFQRILDATAVKTLNKFNAMDKQSFAHSDGYIENAQLQDLQEKVVFIGDANHAVSPFAGNGANLALMDGWDLAESMVLSGNMKEALRRYDELAVGRARKVVGISHLSIRIMHSTGWRLWLWMLMLRIAKVLFFK